MTLATFKDLCIDTTDPAASAPFWGAALGYEVVHRQGSWFLVAPGGDHRRPAVWINDVPESKQVKNRVHLDVHCTSVDELLALGATVLAEPSEGHRWWELLSPEGDELCAFVREEPPADRLYELVVDAVDHETITRWWHDVLGGTYEHEEGDDFAALTDVPGLSARYLVFQTVPEPRTVKNRQHWDVVGEVAALEAAGAVVLAAPTPESGWTVMADPEGNEFCVFAP